MTVPEFWTGNTLIGTTETQVVPQKHDIRKGVDIKADVGNTTTIYIGEKGVTTDNGFPLEPGESVFVELKDPTRVRGIASAANQKAHWLTQ